MKLASFRRPKVTYFLSYVEYRTNTNTAILWKTGYAKEGPIRWEMLKEWIDEGEYGWYTFYTKINIEVLNWLKLP
jgi:hypothetical protein